MDIQRIINTNIPDIHQVYGGVRGRTMSSKQQYHAWPEVIAAGVKTVIDLRDGDKADRYEVFCRQNGIDYFHYPVDKSSPACIQSMVERFPQFCEAIDRGDFYISCAQGLHRTDIAVCTYWVFYGADKGLQPPAVVGYNEDKGKNTEKIMRVLNAVYAYMTERDGVEPMPMAEFKARKKMINEQSKSLGNEAVKVYENQLCSNMQDGQT